VIDAGLLDPLAQGGRALELTGDAAFLAAMLDAELALARSLADTGLAPEWMAEVCDGLAAPGLAAIDLVAIAAESRAGGNPAIPLVRHLSAAAEELRAGASDHLHVGATSQDILDTAAMIVARAVCAEALAQLRRLGEELAALADRHRATPMVGRTLGQHAAPTSLGLVTAAWLDGVTSAIATLAAVRAELPLQYGGAVGTGEALAAAASARGGGGGAEPAGAEPAAVLERLGDRLGLRVPALSWHSNRAPVLGLASALAQSVAAVGVIALDVALLARTEVGELSEGGAPGSGGSSAMPHKRNPVTAVLVVATARRTPQLLASLYGSALSEDQRPSGAWHAEWLPLRDLERAAVAATTAAVDLVRGLEVHAHRMTANLELTAGLVSSERVSTALAAVIGKRAAFDLVERASVESVRDGRTLRAALDGLLAEQPDAARAAAREAFRTAGMDTTAIDRVIAAFTALLPEAS
jgi:3-carboxy-cis,cis-muconate cycloisomerase